MKVKQLTKYNIIDLYKICCPYEEPYLGAMKESAEHFVNKMNKGWKGFVAYKDDEVVGRAEIAPIEECLVAIEGEDVYFLYCLWIKKEEESKGYGRKLMEKIIEVSKNKSGLATITVEGWMPQTFFKHFGFDLVQSKGILNLMLKRFDPKAEVEFKDVKFNPKIIDNKVNVTVVHSKRCPFMTISYNKAIEVAKNISDKVIITEHILKTQEDILRYGDENFYIDSEAPFIGPIKIEKLQEIIKGKIKEKFKNIK